jgi:hypothetical protein
MRANAENLLRALYIEVDEDVPMDSRSRHLVETMLDVKEYFENLAFEENLDGIIGKAND